MARIVFVNRFFAPDESATSQLLTDLTISLAEDGHRVSVVASRQLYGDPNAVLPKKEDLNGVEIYRIWTTRFGRTRLLGRAVDYLSFYLLASVQLLRILRSDDIVVSKTDPPMLSTVVVLCARVRRARSVNWLQDLFPEIAMVHGVPFSRGVVGNVLTWLRDKSLQQARLNVVVGNRMAEVIRARGVSAEKIKTIYNWSDGAAVAPLSRDKNPLDLAWNLNGKFVIGYSGNMGRTHDLHALLDAAGMLSEDDHIRFLFIGDGKLRRELEREALRRELLNVVFKPYQPRSSLNLSLTLPDVHVVSLAPQFEGFVVPSKFYGVAAAGRATLFLGSTSGEIGTILQSENCGVAVDPYDVKAIVLLIRRWAGDPGEVEAMGRRARQVFERRFDKRIAYKEWSDLLSWRVP